MLERSKKTPATCYTPWVTVLKTVLSITAPPRTFVEWTLKLSHLLEGVRESSLQLQTLHIQSPNDFPNFPINIIKNCELYLCGASAPKYECPGYARLTATCLDFISHGACQVSCTEPLLFKRRGRGPLTRCGSSNGNPQTRKCAWKYWSLRSGNDVGRAIRI